MNYFNKLIFGYYIDLKRRELLNVHYIIELHITVYTVLDC